MSRAFVKESDDAAQPPLPERAQSPHPNYVTARGMERLRARLERLRAAAARPPGGDALDARATRAALERDIRYLAERLKRAIVVEAGAAPPEQVRFGTTVTVADQQGEEFAFTIVGEDEADTERYLVSWVSPVARALLGARVGEVVRWRRPDGDTSLEILDISAADAALLAGEDDDR